MTTLSLEVSAFLKICESIDTPRALTCYLLVKNSEWHQYLDLEIPAKGWTRDDRLVTECFRKNVDLPLGIDRQGVALQKFFEAEAACKLTNERLQALFDHGNPDPKHRALLRDVRYWVARILGNLSKEKLVYAESKFRFGPGASSVCVGGDVYPSRKYACDMHVTKRLRPLVKAFMGLGWFTSPHGDVIVNDTSKVSFVPKNARTDRTICVEPHGNMYVQLGIGALIRRQLKLFGINLDHGQDWNRFLASMAGSWGLSTIDLSMASDTIARNLVRWLLPKHWYQLLFLARVDITVVNGKTVQLEKFSSMGNGFTFELETLLFAAIALASGADRKLLAVYGDDIIVERVIANKLVDNLAFLGFKVNDEKTFIEGNFFESCGADFNCGLNVRPFYFKGQYNDTTEAILLCANAIRRYASSSLPNGYTFSDARFLPAWLDVIHRGGREVRLTGIPEGFGDGGLLREFAETPKSRRPENGWQGFVGRVIARNPVRRQRLSKDETGGYLLSLRKAREVPSTFCVREQAVKFREASMQVFPEYVRGRTVLGGLKDIHCWQWMGVGPWI